MSTSASGYTEDGLFQLREILDREIRARREQHTRGFARCNTAHHHTSGAPGLYAKHRIFKDQCGTRFTAELVCRFEEQIGRRLSAFHLFGANDDLDTRREFQSVEYECAVFCGCGGCDSDRDASRIEQVEIPR